LPNTSTGETVVPGMPMLPGAGEFLPEAPASSNGYVWPTRGTFTSGYGWRWGRMHRGIDIAGPVGTPIVAAASGVVVRSGWNSGGYGNVVDIRHPDGSMTRYAHNSRLLVREGQQVRQGQSIAHMGSTGYSTGPHLHFEIHLPGSGTVNPIAYLPGR
jgi:murein DD-endopeptidase MepM/ murein hydrolase activator NlpD